MVILVLLNDIFLKISILIGGNFNYGRDPGWRIPMRPIFNPQSTTMTPNGTTTMTPNAASTNEPGNL